MTKWRLVKSEYEAYPDPEDYIQLEHYCDNGWSYVFTAITPRFTCDTCGAKCPEEYIVQWKLINGRE
mgnify:CR=1 FL=1